MSNYTKTLDLLQELCLHMGYTFCRLDGHTPTSQRQRLVNNFNSPYSQDFVFLLSSKAGGVGLNLVGASHLVLYDIDWNPANDMQVRRSVACIDDTVRALLHIVFVSTRGCATHIYICLLHPFCSKPFLGNGSSVERWPEENGSHLSSPHCRSEQAIAHHF